MPNQSKLSLVHRPDDPGFLRFIGESSAIPKNLTKYVSLSDLEKTDPVRTVFAILLAQVINYKKTGSGLNDRSLYSRVSQSTNKGNNFDKTMTLMCLNSPPGANTMIVTLDGHKSDEIFSQCLVARDRQGGFGPGAIVAIRCPEMISTYFGEKAGLPVLRFSGGMKLVDQVKSKIRLGTIPSSAAAQRTHAFHYTKATLTLNQMYMSSTNCCGNLCDSIDLKSADGTWKSSCACFVVSRGVGSVVFDLNFTVKTDVGQIFEVTRFTSRCFTLFVTKNGIPSSINVKQIEKSGADWVIFKELDDLFAKINNSGGFDILGWIRVGRKNDASSTDGTPTTFQSSDMIRHVTRLKPHGNVTVHGNVGIDIEGILAKCQIQQVPDGGDPPSVPVPPVLPAPGIGIEPAAAEVVGQTNVQELPHGGKSSANAAETVPVGGGAHTKPPASKQ